jgi:hypothetical protein
MRFNLVLQGTRSFRVAPADNSQRENRCRSGGCDLDGSQLALDLNKGPVRIFAVPVPIKGDSRCTTGKRPCPHMKACTAKLQKYL